MLERGSRPADYGEDNFQARYIIRHYWDGPVNCANPRFGVWGGPPSHGQGGMKVARDLAFVNRDAKLDSFVTAAAHAELGLEGAAPAATLPHEVKRERALKGGGDSSSDGGCAHCSADDGRLGAGAMASLGLLGLLGLIRRRRG